MTTEKQLYRDRITRDPAVMVGKPVITGTRIPVERVIAHLAHEPHLADLLAAYPELTIDDVKAALEYAHAAVAKRSARSSGHDASRARPAHV